MINKQYISKSYEAVLNNGISGKIPFKKALTYYINGVNSEISKHTNGEKIQAIEEVSEHLIQASFRITEGHMKGILYKVGCGYLEKARKSKLNKYISDKFSEIADSNELLDSDIKKGGLYEKILDLTDSLHAINRTSRGVCSY